MTPYYQQDGITIWHGDCREILPGLAKADLVMTDPPYGIDFASQPTKWQRRKDAAPEDWDGQPFDDIGLVVAAGVKACIWGGNYYPLPIRRGWLAWMKPDAPPSMGSFELAWTTEDRPARHFMRSIARTNAERLGHPTQKPQALITWAIGQFPGTKTVVDPFLGSGTTLRACKDLGLTAVGIEAQECYCEMAAQRLAQGVLAF